MENGRRHWKILEDTGRLLWKVTESYGSNGSFHGSMETSGGFLEGLYF
jgi:hypothetical protein